MTPRRTVQSSITSMGQVTWKTYIREENDVVKSTKRDIPTDAITFTPFVNLMGNNLLDYLNYKRYKIIKQ